MSTLPTLSTAGIIQADMGLKLDRLIAYWYVTDELQSNLYKDSIECLPKIWSDSYSRPERFKTLCEESLRRLLGRYYSVLTVEVTPEEDIGNPSKIKMVVDICIAEVGGEYFYKRQVFGDDSVAVRVMNVVNVGNDDY